MAVRPTRYATNSTAWFSATNETTPAASACHEDAQANVRTGAPTRLFYTVSGALRQSSGQTSGDKPLWRISAVALDRPRTGTLGADLAPCRGAAGINRAGAPTAPRQRTVRCPFPRRWSGNCYQVKISFSPLQSAPMRIVPAIRAARLLHRLAFRGTAGLGPWRTAKATVRRPIVDGARPVQAAADHPRYRQAARRMRVRDHLNIMPTPLTRPFSARAK